MVEKVDYAQLSLAVYGDDILEGWVDFLDKPWDLNDQIGFYARAYQNLATGEVVLAFRGTEPSDPHDVLGADVAIANAAYGGEGRHPQFLEALKFGLAVRDEARKRKIDASRITVTGHSLGGYLAQLAADVYGWGGQTFEAPGALEVTQGTSADQFADFLNENNLSFGNAGPIGHERVEWSLISHIGTAIGGSKVTLDAGNDMLGFFKMIAAWRIAPSSAAAIWIVARDQYGRHGMEAFYQRTLRESKQGALLQKLMEQFTSNGVADYSEPNRGMWDIFKSMFDGVPQMTQGEAEALVATMEQLRDDPASVFNASPAQAPKEELLRALDEIYMATQDVTVTTSQTSWLEDQDSIDNWLGITITLQHVLNYGTQRIRVDFPVDAFDGVTGQFEKFLVAGTALRPVESWENGLTSVEYFEVEVPAGQSSVTLSLKALPDTDFDDETISNIRFTPLNRYVNGPSTQFLTLTITDSGPETPPGPFDYVIVGDLKPADQDPSTPGVQTATDELGNIIVDPSKPSPNREDVLYDSVGSDRILAEGGNDQITAYRGGDDELDGGAGDDRILAGAGDDQVAGGPDSDAIAGQNGRDKLFADQVLPEDQAKATFDAQASSGRRGDLIDGGAGDDFIGGWDGNDAMFGGNGSDVVMGGGGDDTIRGDRTANSFSLDWDVQRNVFQTGNVTTYQILTVNFGTVDTTGGNDRLYGGEGADWIFGDQGDDYVDGGGGEDVLFGGSGDDALMGGRGDDVLNGDGAEVSEALHGNDYLNGGNGDDRLQGGSGADYLAGGPGNDRIYGDDSGSTTPGDDIILGGPGEDWIWGGGGDDLIDGGDGNDGDGTGQLVGGSGRDVIYGGAGNDYLFGDDPTIPVAEHDADELYGGVGDDMLDGNGGDDWLRGDEGSDTLYGREGNDILEGGDGADYLDGGPGADRYVGGSGDDVIVLDDEDLALWSSGDGRDYIQGNGGTLDVRGFGSVGALLLPGDIGGEQGFSILSGTEGFDISGGFLAARRQYMFDDGYLDHPTLMRRMPALNLRGSTGADEIYGSDQADVIRGDDERNPGTDGDDRIFGQGGDDTLSGGMGADMLDGGSGADSMSGGSGDDRYIVDDTGDQVLENPGEGRDRVLASVSWTLGAEVEELQLTGSTAIDGTGNALDNGLEGNAAANTLDGQAGDDLILGREGDDVLRGGLGADTIYGDQGADRLVGGPGADLLDGGSGDDIYEVSIGDGEDVIDDPRGFNTIRFAGGITPAMLTLSQFVGDDGSQYLAIDYGPGDRLLVRNGLAGAISEYRFDGGTVLSHGDLVGQAPVPYSLDGTSADDVLIGAGLNDRIRGRGGNDTLEGMGGDDELLGEAGDDILRGGAGADLLDGGLGADRLEGGSGADEYLLSWGGGVDTVADGGPEVNRIRLGAGLKAEDLEVQPVKAGLRLAIRGSDDAFILEGYQASGGGWDVVDETGMVTALSSLMPTGSSAFDFDTESRGFLNGIKGTYFGAIRRDGGALQADGRMRRIKNSSGTTYIGGALTNYRRTEYWYDGLSLTTRIVDDPLIVRASSAMDSTTILLTSGTVTSASYSAELGGQTLGGIGGATFYPFDGGSAGYSIPAGGFVVEVTSGSGGDGVTLDGYGQGPTGSPTGIWVYGPSAGASLGSALVYRQEQYEEWEGNRVVAVEVIKAGPSDNLIDVSGTRGGVAGGYLMVDAGDGADVILGGNRDGSLWFYGRPYLAEDFLSSPDEYDGPYDSRAGGSLYYGNDGNDVILGDRGGNPKSLGKASNDLVVGGRGNDWLDGGAGEDTYRFNLGDAGTDVVLDTGILDLYLHMEAMEYRSRAIDWYKKTYPGQPFPVIDDNDYGALAEFVAAGVMPKDTVEFGPGITVSDLSFSWGEITVQPQVGNGWGEENIPDLGQVHVTLDIAWAPGEAVRVVIPHSGFSQPGSGLLPPLSPGGGGPGPVIPDQYLGITGLGIEQIRFSDGTTMNMADVIALAPAAPTLDPQLLDNTLQGTSDADFFDGAAGNDTLLGLDGDDSLFGAVGDDLLDGGKGNDLLDAGAGTDTYRFRLGDGQDVIGDGLIYVPGRGTDAIEFERSVLPSSVDLEQVGGDLVIRYGGLGDSITVRRHFDALTPEDGSGVRFVRFADGLQWDLGDLQVLSDSADSYQVPAVSSVGAYPTGLIFGRGGDDSLTGWKGDDILVGGEGADTLAGGDGDDVYYVDDPGDTVTDTSGNDTVYSTIGYTLGAGLENLVMQNQTRGSLYAYGNELNNEMRAGGGGVFFYAGQGDDTLEGGFSEVMPGAWDYLYGQDGNDTIRIHDRAGVAWGGDGMDAIYGGSSAWNYLFGEGGDDFIQAGAGNALLFGGYGNDTLRGGAGNDVLYGNQGNDDMAGGAGNDAYYVTDPGDVVTEAVDEGIDRVISSIDYTLGANVENLTYTDSAAHVAYGNELDNEIRGGQGNLTAYGGDGDDTLLAGAAQTPTTGWDVFYGENGNDTIRLNIRNGGAIGGAGNDSLYGGSGSLNYLGGDAGDDYLEAGTGYAYMNGGDGQDTLVGGGAGDYIDGGRGADMMSGGLGNDTFLVDDIGDQVTENPGEGIDQVQSSVDFVLGANVENLTLTGAAELRGEGNGLDNVLIARNAGNAYLYGKDGNDTLRSLTAPAAGATATWDYFYAGNGNDALYLRSRNGAAFGEAGDDLVVGGSGFGALFGGSGNDRLVGSAGTVYLSGGAGDDVIESGSSYETISGGAGNDVYVYGRGDAGDMINDFDYMDSQPAQYGATTDILQFESGIDHDQLWFSQVGNNLQVDVIGTSDSVTVSNWYLGAAYQLDYMDAGDGLRLYANQVDQLVQAMAAFAPPAAGELDLSPQLQTALAPTLAASWQTAV